MIGYSLPNAFKSVYADVYIKLIKKWTTVHCNKNICEESKYTNTLNEIF